ncbi:hypothetical protein SUDANB95_03113 [Actinosynnema sp. ALI-1.44]
MLGYVTLVGAVAAAAAPLLSGGAARSDVVDPTVVGLAVGVVAMAALARVRAARVVAACGAVAVAGGCGWLLAVDLGTGLAGPRVPVLAAGALAVAVGAAWSAAARSGPGRSGRDQGGPGRVGPVGVVAAVVAVGVVALAPVAAEAAVVRSSPREARGFDAPAVVERPGGGQWAWQPGAAVVGVVSAGHGVVVALADGSVVALSGSDGREDWRYARRGAHVGALVASMDRNAVVATFRTGRDTRRHLMVVFDADTGRVRFERLVRAVTAEVDDIVPGTRTLALPEGAGLTGYDLVTGERRWQWSPSDGCAAPYVRAVRGRSTAFAVEECADRLVVVALDEVSGERRWEHRVPLAGSGGERRDVHLKGTPDGSAVSVRVVTADVAPGAVTDGVFDADTGALSARPTREPPPDDPACAGRRAHVTTATTSLRVCDDNGRELTVVTQGLEGSAVTRTPVRLDGSGSPARVHLVPAPGAVVVARSAFGGTPAPVVGLTGP